MDFYSEYSKFSMLLCVLKRKCSTASCITNHTTLSFMYNNIIFNKCLKYTLVQCLSPQKPYFDWVCLRVCRLADHCWRSSSSRSLACSVKINIESQICLLDSHPVTLPPFIQLFCHIHYTPNSCVDKLPEKPNKWSDAFFSVDWLACLSFSVHEQAKKLKI